ncbi:MAG TPA: IS630 family transposase [Chloroflexota bacterium]
MRKRYHVELSDADRHLLQKLIHSGNAPARALTHARILLKADEADDGSRWQDEQIAEALETSVPTVERTRKRFIQGGLDDALYHRPPSKTKPKKLDGHAEAHLIALSCSEPPCGRDHWTMQLLADKFVELYDGPVVSDELVRRTLKKTFLKPHLKEQWCIPPKQSAAFVWHMEDVLDVYTRAYDPRYPQICFDERPVQLLADVREALPSRPGIPRREDYEYERRGIANLFLWYEPLQAKRHVLPTERRTMADWAHCIKDLVDVHYPDAKRIVLVMDNLNTHSPASLYAAFPPAEAKRIADKLEIHPTPKHGSWLNMAEVEIAVLSTQCLDRRIPDLNTVKSEVAAWEEERNRTATTIDWRFTTDDARIKLKRLYPAC